MAKSTRKKSVRRSVGASEADGKRCGIIMPISLIDGLNEGHWLDVRAILVEAITAAGFTPNLVSDADESGIIQQRIIQNVYANPIVVCDVSGKNPNVMFELGLRLAFDKPAIIVKDDKTSYSFDTAPIQHLQYPRDLRFGLINAFQKNLTASLIATHRASQEPNYSTFLKNFGTFSVAQLETKEVSKEDFIIEELKAIRQQLNTAQASSPASVSPDTGAIERYIKMRRFVGNCLEQLKGQNLSEFEMRKALTEMVASDKEFLKSYPTEQQFVSDFKRALDRSTALQRNRSIHAVKPPETN